MLTRPVESPVLFKDPSIRFRRSPVETYSPLVGAGTRCFRNRASNERKKLISPRIRPPLAGRLFRWACRPHWPLVRPRTRPATTESIPKGICVHMIKHPECAPVLRLRYVLQISRNRFDTGQIPVQRASALSGSSDFDRRERYSSGRNGVLRMACNTTLDRRKRSAAGSYHHGSFGSPPKKAAPSIQHIPLRSVRIARSSKAHYALLIIRCGNETRPGRALHLRDRADQFEQMDRQGAVRRRFRVRAYECRNVRPPIRSLLR